MLTHMGIRDLAVVEFLDLEFEPGLSVLTGETGAGKSILLTALGLALGDRADSGYIRTGASRAEINLSFVVADNPAAQNWLNENEMADGGDCLIRRIISQDGRSKAFVNGRPTTLQGLQDLGESLVEIHGQHAHVRLLKAHEQRQILDEIAGNDALLERIAQLSQRWRALANELRTQREAAEDQAAREELLRYQLEELDQHDIARLEYPTLIQEHSFHANVGKILASGQSQLDALYDGDTDSVNSRLAAAIQILSGLGELAPAIGECAAMLVEAQLQVKEAALNLRRELEHMDADPKRLEALEQRLADVYRLARKHQVAPEQLPGRLQALRAEWDGLAHRGETSQLLQSEFERVRSEYDAVAADLSAARERAASEIQERISSIVQELGMPQAKLLVKVERRADADPSPRGSDLVEFLVSANPGSPPRSLARVASGGELSRISLAIQVAALATRSVPTLIFDEVDSGIGGGIAEIVGKKLRILGEQGRQVFCVTHLPQVAAQGHQHLLVEKVTDGDTAQSSVRKLGGEQRTREIGRMLGGVRLTAQTLAHAEEMLGSRDSVPDSP